MTTSKPPKYLSDIFNSYFYKEVESVSLTEDQADLRYLKKNITDTATALQTFNAGITVNNSNITVNNGSISSLIVNTTSLGSQADGGGLDIGASQATGILNIGNLATRTGAINIATTKNTTSAQQINIGSINALATGQVIKINRPLTIGYTVNPTSLSQIGGTSFLNGLAQPFPSTGGSVTLAVLNSIPIGIYQVFYNISTVITVATATLTEQITTISDRSADTALANVFNFMINSDLLHQTRIVGHNFTITGGGIFVNTTANISIYLNQRFIYASGPTVNATGHLRIVRIG